MSGSQDSTDADGATAEEPTVKLTASQRARIERNRQKALLLRQARIQSRPYPSGTDIDDHRVKGLSRQVDTGAGFFLEEDDEHLRKMKMDIKHPLGPVMAVDSLLCEDCNKEFLESFLLNHFSVSVCDICRKNQEKEKYNLITKSDAKKKYLLKDVDFDKREPTLKFVLRKNPHNPRWGDMKLYLESECSARAMEVWGSMENIDKAKDQRVENQEKLKQKKFDKRVKELRLAVRSSLWRKESGGHEHEYGQETYNEEDDIYSKSCSCGHVMTYEKM